MSTLTKTSLQSKLDAYAAVPDDVFMDNWCMHLRALKLEFDLAAPTFEEIESLALPAVTFAPLLAVAVDAYSTETFSMFPSWTEELVLEEPFYQDDDDKEFFVRKAPEAFARHNVYAYRVLERN